MGKNPAFQFYPRDWLMDLELRSCSLAARGLWIDLIATMHFSQKYGFLLINGTKPDYKTITKVLNLRPEIVQKRLQELVEKGVARVDENGVIYSNRMVQDQRLRDIRREAGSKGGNPNLLNQELKQKDKQDGYPACTPPPSPSPSPSPSPRNTGRKPLFLKGFLKDHPDIHEVVSELRKSEIWDPGSTLGKLLRDAPLTPAHVIKSALTRVLNRKPADPYPYFRGVLVDEVEKDLTKKREEEWEQKKNEDKREAPEALKDILGRLETRRTGG